MWWMLAACSPDCSDGFIEKDGLCYAEEEERESVADPLNIDNIIDSLPPCTASPGDGDLDLLGGCAGDVCIGQSYEDYVAVLGAPELSPSSSDPTSLYVQWPEFRMFLPDLDLDGQPDAGSSPTLIFIDPTYTGSTLDGQRIGAEISCFVGLSPIRTINLFTYDGVENASFFFEGFLVSSDDGVLANEIALSSY